MDYHLLTSIEPKYDNWRDCILWSYSNLQMTGVLHKMGEPILCKTGYMIRSKAYKAYSEGRWTIHDMYDLNKEKVRNNNTCWYCGSTVNPEELTADHVFPRVKGGSNSVDNIVYVCRHCNSSKGKKDLMEWLIEQNLTPTYYVLEQYLKEVWFYSLEHGICDKDYSEIVSMQLPFNPKSVVLFQNKTYIKHLLTSLHTSK